MSTKAKHRVLFKDYLKAQLKDPAFKKAFNKADLPVRIAIALAQLRERRGLTQGQLAKRMGTTQQVVSRLEKGEEINPRLTTLAKAAEALGTHLELAFRPSQA